MSETLGPKQKERKIAKRRGHQFQSGVSKISRGNSRQASHEKLKALTYDNKSYYNFALDLTRSK